MLSPLVDELTLLLLLPLLLPLLLLLLDGETPLMRAAAHRAPGVASTY